MTGIIMGIIALSLLVGAFVLRAHQKSEARRSIVMQGAMDDHRERMEQKVVRHSATKEATLARELEAEAAVEIPSSVETPVPPGSINPEKKLKSKLIPRVETPALDPAKSGLARMRRLSEVKHVGEAFYRLPKPLRTREVEVAPLGARQLPRGEGDYLAPDPKLERVEILICSAEGDVELVLMAELRGTLVHLYAEDYKPPELELVRKLWMQMARKHRLAPSSGREYLYALLDHFPGPHEAEASQWFVTSNLLVQSKVA
jgi:hypothetical protein